ncbi:MAG TPA: hypothetical protein DCE47_03120 [Planctomycetaceae bacterium]|nr:hypothetical protein [Planctomycetaceae bacterium]
MVLVALHELKFVRQYEGEMLRRWFDDDEGLFDLIAWVDDAGAVSGFQLAYNVNGEERAITWLGGTFSHRDVDPGDDSPLSNDSSVLGDTTVFPIVDIIKKFEHSSRNIASDVRSMLLGKLEEFAGTLSR